MSRPVRPLVAGVMGGVGTTVIASALGAYDDDLFVGGAVDVLVCESTVPSLTAAHSAVGRTEYPPILVVVADVPERSRVPVLPGPVKALARMVEPHVTAMVAIPFVSQWRLREDPCVDAATVLLAGAEVPPWLTEFAAAIKGLVPHVEQLMRDTRHRADAA